MILLCLKHEVQKNLYAPKWLYFWFNFFMTLINVKSKHIYIYIVIVTDDFYVCNNSKYFCLQQKYRHFEAYLQPFIYLYLMKHRTKYGCKDAPKWLYFWCNFLMFLWCGNVVKWLLIMQISNMKLMSIW